MKEKQCILIQRAVLISSLSSEYRDLIKEGIKDEVITRLQQLPPEAFCIEEEDRILAEIRILTTSAETIEE